VITLAEVLRRSTAYLESRGSPTPRLDAELLLSHGLGLSRVELYTQFDRPLTEDELAACRELVRRRGTREPVAYVIGRWGFRRLDLEVDARVLVPRPETELVVDRCLLLLEGLEAPAVVDVGTGSGAIALAIKDERPDAAVAACDVSPDALAVARGNAARLGLDVAFAESDLLDAVDGGPFDLVVSNPPYVASGEIDTLEPEVAEHEPRLATASGAGEDGLGVYRRLLPQAAGRLRPGGAVVVECGAGQAGALVEQLRALGYGDPGVDRDLAGIDRVVWATWR
jgi:release factor glutamine methyltransferase